MTHAEHLVVARAVITLAGPMAQARLYRVSEPGWVPLRPTRERETAVHEAGHAIAGLAFGQHVHRLSIVPDPELRTTDGKYHALGHCTVIPTSKPVVEFAKEFDTDAQTIARAAFLLSPVEEKPLWKAALRVRRSLRAITESVLDHYWYGVLELAAVLERSKFMSQADVQQHLKRMGTKFPTVSLAHLHRHDLAIADAQLFPAKIHFSHDVMSRCCSRRQV